MYRGDFMIGKLNAHHKPYCNGDISKIENYYEAVNDKENVWHIHHRLETHNSDGEKRLVDLTKDELIELDMYYDRPPEELIFVTPSMHNSLHHSEKSPWNKGTKGICKANSGSFKKGLTPWIKGRKHTEEARAKISTKLKGNTPWNKGKSLSDSQMLVMNEMKAAYRNNNPLNLKWNEFQKWYRSGGGK